MAKEKQPFDIEKFFTDPSYTEERTFLRGVFDKFKSEDEEKQKAEAAAKESEEPENMFDRIFSRK